MDNFSSPQARGHNMAKGLGNKIAKAMQMKAITPKQNAASQIGRHGYKNLTGSYGKYPRHLTAPVPMKKRHRKYFGLDNPHQPY